MNRDFIISNDTQIFENEISECPICGKSFYLSNVSKKQYMYKKRNKNGKIRYCCSYSCYNKLNTIIVNSVKNKGD